uniref:ARAD1C38038p n=1 Tax=Blastobotrys adeninivorans TaxID=409370 RepID=A0A060T8M1_BLAAD
MIQKQSHFPPMRRTAPWCKEKSVRPYLPLTAHITDQFSRARSRMSCVPPWVPQFDRCLSKVVGPRLFTLCTISPDGMPHARTCVFRSWLFNDRATGVLLFTADKRSLKIGDMNAHQGRYEACFYFDQSMRQFRLSGFAQTITASEVPSLQASIPQSAPLKSPSTSSRSSSTTSVSPPPSNSGGANNNDHDEREPRKDTTEPSYYPIFTPSYDSSQTYSTEFPPPSKEEWLAEYDRLWNLMSPELKKSFRRPTPRTLVDDQSRQRIDAIFRGVDGDSDDAGKDNFLVVALFVNSVDALQLDGQQEPDSRRIYSRLFNDEWTEQEVCP